MELTCLGRSAFPSSSSSGAFSTQAFPKKRAQMFFPFIQAPNARKHLRGSLTCSVFLTSAAVAASGLQRVKRNGTSSRCAVSCRTRDSDNLQHDRYVRVLCSSIQYVGNCGAIVNLCQLNDINAPHHSLRMPMQFPLFLDAADSNIFQRASNGDFKLPREVFMPHEHVVSELRLVSSCSQEMADFEEELGSDSPGEFVLFERFNARDEGRDDSLIRLEGLRSRERTIRRSAGEVLAVARLFSTPILVDTRYALMAGKAAVDRMLLEGLMCNEEACDVTLHELSHRLSRGCEKDALPATVSSLLEALKPFSWYWYEQGPNMHSFESDESSRPQHRELSHYINQFNRLQKRSSLQPRS